MLNLLSSITLESRPSPSLPAKAVAARLERLQPNPTPARLSVFLTGVAHYFVTDLICSGADKVKVALKVILFCLDKTFPEADKVNGVVQLTCYCVNLIKVTPELILFVWELINWETQLTLSVA